MGFPGELSLQIGLNRNWHLVYKNQLAQKWDRSVLQREICGATIGILGLERPERVKSLEKGM